MKKIVLVLAGTVSVVVLLFGYDTSTSGPLSTGSQTSVVSGSGATGSGASGSGTTAAPAAGTTVTGDTAQTQWGPVQVELTLDGSTITDVSVVQYPNGNGRDQEINSYALPILVQETIDAQSADIDMVSGATVTSTGYVQSLQSAIDQVSA
ncbi:FMN-binding protein [Nocardioides mangrovi]|uniref:FMN-binding protein n=1 Tax=Nocardioides mangrovi TaxID=2874580 RepID=A0ABS7UC82_9ACTN|nr:FMN-binding protein [Nocardioides mangrovi]MBZ5738586.1 FMN-binding protein [Nocardioides mangrovi]